MNTTTIQYPVNPTILPPTKNNVSFSKIIRPVKEWETRIVGAGWEHPNQLLANPNGAFIHPQNQQRALVMLLNEIGWIVPIIVNQRTGHVVDGGRRVLCALDQGVRRIPVLYVDLDQQEEKVVSLAYNATGKQALYDTKKVDETYFSLSGDSLNLAGRLAGEDILPVKGTRSRNRTELKKAPLESQECVKYQVGRGEKQLWKMGEARLLGTPKECAQVVAAWESATGQKAERVL
jgi:hypothetical protein